VIPVARKVWQQVEEGRPAATARRLIIRKTSIRVIGFSVSFLVLSTLLKRGVFFSPEMPALLNTSVHVRFGVVMSGDFVTLTTLLMQPKP
jgi:hypothetical protein